ncbi:MAG: low molecular weight phosphotyrosine protein phosphatase [Gammaproteobacteria bacterium]
MSQAPMNARRVLFVCLGNICRSPLAEGAFRRAVEMRGLGADFEIDSAGSGDWHLGAPPDARAQRAAARRGIDISGLRARQTSAADMAAFDHILAMDRANHADLRRLAGARHAHKVRLLLEHCPQTELAEVPDPYYGEEGDFEHALDLIEAATDALLTHITAAPGKCK